MLLVRKGSKKISEFYWHVCKDNPILCPFSTYLNEAVGELTAASVWHLNLNVRSDFFCWLICNVRQTLPLILYRFWSRKRTNGIKPLVSVQRQLFLSQEMEPLPNVLLQKKKRNKNVEKPQTISEKNRQSIKGHGQLSKWCHQHISVSKVNLN